MLYLADYPVLGVNISFEAGYCCVHFWVQICAPPRQGDRELSRATLQLLPLRSRCTPGCILILERLTHDEHITISAFNIIPFTAAALVGLLR